MSLIPVVMMLTQANCALCADSGANTSELNNESAPTLRPQLPQEQQAANYHAQPAKPVETLPTPAQGPHSQPIDANRQSGSPSANPPQQPQSGNGQSLHEGTDFKIGPVTDDSKLIKPVAGDTDGGSAKKTDAASGAPKTTTSKEAGMFDERQTNQEVQSPHGKISVGALKVAKDLEILPDIREFDSWKETHNDADRRTQLAMAIRQDLHEDIFAVFLQTRRVISELDRQISGYDAVARVLEAKRDQAIRNNNILNFTTAGGIAVTQGAISVGTPMKFQNAGNELGVIAGGLTALIGAYALKIQKGAKRSADAEPNMLAPVFDLSPVEPNKYPPTIWNYLNDYEPGQKATRREQLIQRWRTLTYIDKDADAESLEKIKELCGVVPLKKKVTIDLLRTRIPMLEDVRAAVAGMNEYLDEIFTYVRGPEHVAIKYHTSAKILTVLQGALDKDEKNAKDKSKH